MKHKQGRLHTYEYLPKTTLDLMSKIKMEGWIKASRKRVEKYNFGCIESWRRSSKLLEKEN